jgi:hypothetical protein
MRDPDDFLRKCEQVAAEVKETAAAGQSGVAGAAAAAGAASKEVLRHSTPEEGWTFFRSQK